MSYEESMSEERTDWETEMLLPDDTSIALRPLFCRPTPWVNDVVPAKFGWILMGFLASAEIRYGPNLPVYNEYGNRSLRNILSDYLDVSTDDVDVCLRAMDHMFVSNTYHLLVHQPDLGSSEPESENIIKDAFEGIDDLWKYTHVFADLEQCQQKATVVPTKMWLSPVLKEFEKSDVNSDSAAARLASRAAAAYLSEPGTVPVVELDWGVFSWDPSNIARYNTFVLFRRDYASYLYFGDGQYGLVSDLKEVLCLKGEKESWTSPVFLCYRKRPIDDVTPYYVGDDYDEDDGDKSEEQQTKAPVASDTKKQDKRQSFTGTPASRTTPQTTSIGRGTAARKTDRKKMSMNRRKWESDEED